MGAAPRGEGASGGGYDYSPTLRTTYSYDANGNTTLVNAGGSVTTYCWDSENRMTLAELPSGGRTTAAYDGDGRRRSYADSAGFRGFLWDGENIAGETDGVGATVAAYSYAPSIYGALVSQRRSGATSFHHGACPERSRGDALGSTMQLTNASQAATDSYLYRAFGEQSVLSGSSPNPFTWVGRLGYYRQPDTSDYWVRARVYRPAAGRWVSRDPAASDGVYRYIRNRPLLLTDATGMDDYPGPDPCNVPCGALSGEPRYQMVHRGQAPSGWPPCRPCENKSSMLRRLDQITEGLEGLRQTGRPPWYPGDTGNRAFCYNGNPYYCDHGRHRGRAFIPYWNEQRTWGAAEPCVARCLIAHEFGHGLDASGFLLADFVRQESPAVAAEGRCLLDYLMRMRTECCDEFRRYRERIARARAALSAAVAACSQ